MVDPTDDQSVWSFAEYTFSGNTWGVRAARLLAPPPATPVIASPAFGAPGQTLSVTVTGQSSSGSGFFDTEPGMNRLIASFSGGGIAVNSVQWIDATHVKLNISIAPGAAVGERTLGVVNPDGQHTESGPGLFLVAQACYPNCDASSIAPVLNVLDFSCFLNAYAAGLPYANCDGSTMPPVLNVQDFSCFLNVYAAGCP